MSFKYQGTVKFNTEMASIQVFLSKNFCSYLWIRQIVNKIDTLHSGPRWTFMLIYIYKT